MVANLHRRNVNRAFDISKNNATLGGIPLGGINLPRIFPGTDFYKNYPIAASRPRLQVRKESNFVESPLVTVVIPFTCEKASALDAALESLWRQSLQEYELVIINDGCPDITIKRRLDLYASKHSLLRVQHLPKSAGVPHSVNLGFEYATTDFVFVMDPDGLIEPTTLEKFLWHLHTCPYHAFVNSFLVNFGEKDFLQENGFGDKEAFLNENLVHSMVMVRKSVHSLIGKLNESLGIYPAFWDFWLKSASSGFWGYTIPEHLLWYNQDVQPFSEFDKQQFQKQIHLKTPSVSNLLASEPRLRSSSSHLSLEGRNILPRVEGMQRVFLILNWMEIGGADKYNLDLIGFFAANNWDVTIAATIPWLPSPWRRQGWEIEFLKFTNDVFVLSDFLPPKTAIKATFLAYMLRSRQPDIVFISTSELAYVSLPMLHVISASMKTKPKFYDYVHNIDLSWDGDGIYSGGGYACFSLKFQKYLTKTIVAGDFVRDWLLARGMPRNSVQTCYIGPGPHAYPNETTRVAIRNRLQIPMERTVITYSARLVPGKQPHVFGEVIRLLNSAHKDSFSAIVAGEGPLLSELKSNMSRLDNVIFLGHIEPKRMIDIFQASDIIFIPSEAEGISLVAYESMALGKIFVSAVLGGHRELISNECNCGVLIKKSSPSAEIALYFKELHRLLSDSELRHEIGSNAINVIRDRFSSKMMFRCHLNAFKEGNNAIIMHDIQYAKEASLLAMEGMSPWARDPSIL